MVFFGKLAKQQVGHQGFGATNEKNPGPAPTSAKLRKKVVRIGWLVKVLKKKVH